MSYTSLFRVQVVHDFVIAINNDDSEFSDGIDLIKKTVQEALSDINERVDNNYEDIDNIKFKILSYDSPNLIPKNYSHTDIPYSIGGQETRSISKIMKDNSKFMVIVAAENGNIPKELINN